MALAKNRSAVITILLASLCAGPWGCATRARPAPAVRSEEVRLELNVVGVPAVRMPPYFRLELPPAGKGWGALKGAGYGLAGGAMPGLAIASVVGHCGGGGALICVGIGAVGLGAAVAGGAIGAVGGTVYGAVAAESAWRVEAAQAALRSVLEDPRVQSAIRAQVLMSARDDGSLSLVALEEHELDGSSHYRALAMTRGADTLLELDAATISLEGRGINPPLRLVMTSSPRLVRTADNVELHIANFEYRGLNEHKLVAWAADDGRAFREEVERGAKALAGDIVRMLLQSATARAPEPVAPGPEPDGEGAEATTPGS